MTDTRTGDATPVVAVRSPAPTTPPASAAPDAAERRDAAVAALPATLDAALGGGGDTWALAVLDVRTGERRVLGDTNGAMVTGSVVKLTLLESLLRVRGGVDGLGDDDRALAEAMITQSDNDAALTLWSEAGGDTELQRTLDLLGMTQTLIDPEGWFGASSTSATDQLAPLEQLIRPTFLAAADVAYVRGLLGEVATDQRWGVPTMADPGTATENKNGWLDNDDDGGLWLINSLGLVTIGGESYLVAALSQHQPDFDTGVQRLNTALAAVATALRK